MPSTLGHKLLAGLVDSKKGVHEFLELDLNSDLFTELEDKVYQYINHHVMKYGVIPASDTIKDETGVALPAVKEPPTYYLEQVRNRQLQTSLKSALQKSAVLLNNDNPIAALKDLQ